MNRIDNVIPNPLPKAELPEVRNQTTQPCQYFQAVDPDNEVFHVMVLRATYDMTRSGENGQLLLAQDQSALAEADIYAGKPGESSLIWESDFAPYKPKCHVLLLNANAYAPDQTASEGWPVSISCGDMKKVAYVTGPREFSRAPVGWHLNRPEKAHSVPLEYQYAYGGSNRFPTEPDDAGQYKLHETCPENTLGCGFAHPNWLNQANPERYAAPQLEVPDMPFTGQKDYPVVGFGPIARSWMPRLKLAGTYDEQWKAERWPRLPADHDYAYWNCAPEDQQINYPQGGEYLELINLHPEYARIGFYLPADQYKGLIRMNAGSMVYKPFNLDTLGIDMQKLQLHALFRVAVPAHIGVRVLEIHQETDKHPGESS